MGMSLFATNALSLAVDYLDLGGSLLGEIS